MNEDLELLRHAIEEPVDQMLLAEVSSPQHALRLATQIQNWSSSSRSIKTVPLDANIDDARDFYDLCQQLAQTWKEDDEPPALLILVDQSVADERIAHPTSQQPTSVGFWRSMNLLREGWNDLPCQTVFLITPQQYYLFSTEADHLKRWIPLKLHIEESENALPQPRHERGIIEPSDEELRPKFAGQDDIDDRGTALAQWDSLRQRELLAIERGDKPETVARRQQLPLFVAAIALERWEDAKRYATFLKDARLPMRDELRRLNLETFFQQRQGNSQQAEVVAQSAIELAMKQGKESDQLIAQWTLGMLYDSEKQWDKYEHVLDQLFVSYPNNADVLGRYAHFLSYVQGKHDRAEELFKRAIEVKPNSPAAIGSYANFLANIRREYEHAEALFERVIEIDPNRYITLGNYANFLTGVRGDYDRAERLYKRSIEINSNYSITLYNYATFLRNVRKELDGAEEFYDRAIQVDGNDADILNNYANFIAYERGDYNKAESLYERAVDNDKSNPVHLVNYAVFLAYEREDFDRAEDLYKNAINVIPTRAVALNDYADFLVHARKDSDQAEKLHERAAELDPAQSGRYAVFLCLNRKDYERAEPYFLKALEAAPDDTQNNINSAAFFLFRGKREKGRELLERAATRKDLSEPQRVAVAFHRYIHFARETPTALSQLKQLLQAGDRARSWSFAENIKRARKEKHPNARLLEVLAEVVSGDKDIKILNNFAEWTRA